MRPILIMADTRARSARLPPIHPYPRHYGRWSVPSRLKVASLTTLKEKQKKRTHTRKDLHYRRSRRGSP